MTSQKTVCSDAFDFLFDSENLNPDTIQVWKTKNRSVYPDSGRMIFKTYSMLQLLQLLQLFCSFTFLTVKNFVNLILFRT
jgi:hypothetical protein